MPDQDDKSQPSPSEGSGGAAQATVVRPKGKPATRKQTKQLPPYNVVLLDDDDHTYEYVIEMLRAVFAYSETKGFIMAQEVDNTGRVIVFTAHKELAELKRDQITAYGADARMASSKGSMTAVVEPAEGGG